MRINEKLGSLLTLLMEQSWHPESVTVSRKRMELTAVKEYLDEHYTEKLTLDELAEKFFINKFYLSKIFKEMQTILVVCSVRWKAAVQENIENSGDTGKNTLCFP